MLETIREAIDAALHQVGLPLRPATRIRLTRDRYRQVLQFAQRDLISKGISPRRRVLPLLNKELRSRYYSCQIRVKRRARVAPITIRRRIGDIMTDVLSRQGIPPSQVAKVELPIYAEVIRKTAAELSKRGIRVSRFALASELQKRRYAPVQPKQPPYYASVPAEWRRAVPGQPREQRWSTPRGIFTGIKPITMHGTVVRGVR